MSDDDEVDPFTASCLAEFERLKNLQPYTPPLAPVWTNAPGVVTPLQQEQPPPRSKPND